MNPVARALLTALLPLVALAAAVFAVLLVLLDLLVTPLVWLLRRPPRDERPRTRDASIVVLNWNGVDFLKELMPSLRVAVARCPGEHEVIVVDNGSSDDSTAWLRREHPWTKLVPLPENLHFIRGNAAGAKVATRDLIVYLNNDMRVEPDWLVALLQPFAADARGDLFATTSRIEMQGQRKETGLTRCFVKKGELRFVQPAGTDADDGAPVLWAGGGCSAFDRRKHDAIGGFERLYVPCYVEDVSLSYQAWRRGWRAVYCHQSVVHHAHRGSSSKVFARAALERLDWRNRELLFVRSITDPRLVLAHGLWLWWNLPKRARQLDLTVADGVLAALQTMPRLPAAVWQRETARRHYRRGDAAVVRTTATMPQTATNGGVARNVVDPRPGDASGPPPR